MPALFVLTGIGLRDEASAVRLTGGRPSKYLLLWKYLCRVAGGGADRCKGPVLVNSWVDAW